MLGKRRFGAASYIIQGGVRKCIQLKLQPDLQAVNGCSITYNSIFPQKHNKNDFPPLHSNPLQRNLHISLINFVPRMPLQPVVTFPLKNKKRNRQAIHHPPVLGNSVSILAEMQNHGDSLCIYSNGNFVIILIQQVSIMFPNQQFGSYFPQAYPLQPYFSGFVPTIDIFEQLNNTLSILNEREQHLKNEVQKLKNQIETITTTTAQALTSILTQQCSKHMQKIKKSCEQNCFFKKDQLCSVKGCNKKYSSRIALRAHLRRKHSKRELENMEHKS